MRRARGDSLTAIGRALGVERSSFLLFFKEPDFLLRKRLRKTFFASRYPKQVKGLVN